MCKSYLICFLILLMFAGFVEAQDFVRIERRYGLPQGLLSAVHRQESAGGMLLGDYRVIDILKDDAQRHALNKIARHTGRSIESFYGSCAGALGPFQILPDTYWRYKQPNTQGKFDPLDPESSALTAAHYLARLLALHHGDLTTVLQTYSGNAKGYVTQVLTAMQKD